MYSYDRRRNLGWLILLSCAGTSALPSCSSPRPNFTVPDKDGTGGDQGGSSGDGDGDGSGGDQGDGDGDGSGGKQGDGDGDGSGGDQGDGDGDTSGSGGSTSCDGIEVDGACILACETEGEVRCEGECIDPKTNVDFCGATEGCQEEGEVCDSDESCVLGACRSWGEEEEAGPFVYSGYTGEIALVMDNDGTATLSYNESEDALVAKRRAVGGSWSSAHTLDDDVSTTSFPKLAVDGDGNVLSMWASNGFGHGWARYRAQPASWGSSAALDLGAPESGPYFATPVVMAAAPGGDVFIGFDNVNFAAGTEAWTRRFGFEADGWYGADRHDENGTEEASFGTLVVDGDSNVTAIWTERVSTTEAVARASHWSASDNEWSASSDLGDGWRTFRGAADADGNVALVSCSSATIVPHTYDRAKGSWSAAPALVDDSDTSIAGCMIASNGYGDMMLSWSQNTPDGRRHLVSRRNPTTRTWQGATNIMDVPDGSTSATIGMDAAGNAWVVAYLYDGGDGEIIARRFSAEQQVWEDEITIASATEPEVLSWPRVAVSQSGSAVVVWPYQEGSSSSYTLRSRTYE